MTYPGRAGFQIKNATVMPRAQVRFRRRFTNLMRTSAERIGAIVLRAAEDDVVPVESIGQVSGAALDVIDQLFLGNGGRNVVLSNGMPQSPYARVLLEEIGIVTYESVAAHGRYLARVLPGDIRFWLRSGTRVREQADGKNAVSTRISELTEAEVRARFPQLTDADVELVAKYRIFDPNPLARYEPAHTWVDPNGYRLSDRIWRTDQATRNDLDGLLVDSISQGMSAREIAKLVERFMIPGREKVRTNRPYSSDASQYAMRLARTEISRAANQASYIAAQMNPYADKIEIVRSANGDVTCPICPQHATIDISGERLRDAYPIDAVSIPPYHPHDMCRVQPGTTSDLATVENDLRQMLEISRQTNLVPVMNPADIEGFTQQLLGEILWNITRQVLPAQPSLF